jgi:uncharacterized repeat protein (TIGR03847 family)
VRRRIIDLDDPEVFAVRCIVQDGTPRCYLEALESSRSAVVSLQPEQLEMLVERMLVVIDELERRGLAAIDLVETSATRVGTETMSSDAMIEDFHASVLTIDWDDDVDRLIVEARSTLVDEGAGESASPGLEDADDEIPDDAPIGPDVMRVHLRLPMLQQFVRGAIGTLNPMLARCPVCNEPLDPRGHDCAGDITPA